MKTRLLIYFSLISFFLLCSTALQARHILGGSVTYEQTSPTNYTVRVQMFRDCYGGGAPFDFQALISIYKIEDGAYISHEDLSVELTSSEEINLVAENTVCAYPEGICVEKGDYYFDIELPENSGIYSVIYQRCCRSNILSNILEPGTVGMTFTTEINTNIQNSSPSFNKDIPLVNFTNVSFVHDGGSTDTDGDSLVYELSAPLIGGGLLGTLEFPGDVNACDGVTPFPACPPPFGTVSYLLPTFSVDNMLGGNFPLSIDPMMGEMSAVPTLVGVFQIGYVVKEYRDGNLIGSTQREFMFVTIAEENEGLNDVGGTVWIDSITTLDIGKVELFRHNLDADSLEYVSEVNVTEMGQYNFPTIPTGVHYLRASPDPTSIYFEDYMPTYYRSDILWYEANIISECDTSDYFRDIYLIPQTNLGGGLELSGYIASGIGTVVADLSIILFENTLDIVQHTTTDENGYFTFKDLPTGNYSILVDLVNSEIDNSDPPLIDLTNNASYIFTLYDTHLNLDGLTNTFTPFVNEQFQLFPNPAKEELFVKTDLAFTNMAIQVFNTNGQLVLEKKQNLTDAIDIANIVSGVYFVKLIVDGEQFVQKLIIQ